MPVARFVMNGKYNKLEEYLDGVRRQVELKEGNDQEPDNLVPDTSSHPDSLREQMKRASAEERYDDAVYLRGKIKAVRDYLAQADDFIRWAGEIAIVDYTPQQPHKARYTINGTSLTVSRATEQHGSEDVLYVSNPSSTRPLFDIRDPEYLSRIFGLVHSDPFVLRFPRFDTQMYQNGKNIN